MKTTKVLLLLGILSLVVPREAMAVITFDQLDQDTFVVSHRVKIYGSRGKAMKVVYEKAASLCIAAGYTHLLLLNQESQAAQEHDTANASVQVQFFLADGEGRIECSKKASQEYIDQAAQKLSKRDYQPPDPSVAGAGTGDEAQQSGTCTVEQITAMVKAGLSEEQIKAACGTQD